MLLRRAVDNVDAAVRVDDARYGADLQVEARIFEGLLHHTATEWTKVAALREGAAVGACGRALRKILRGDARGDLRKLCDGILLALCDLLAGAARQRVARAGVLAQQVGAATGPDAW